MGLREIRRPPSQNLVLLLQRLDPPLRRACNSAASAVVDPARVPSSMSTFFRHEYSVVK
jgi:hypothetical protein